MVIAYCLRRLHDDGDDGDGDAVERLRSGLEHGRDVCKKDILTAVAGSFCTLP